MLIKTAFYIPPLRQHSVFRHPLIDRLNASLGGQLVLVSAPAGYGKTTLVSQWLHAKPHAFCWLTLDSSQSSPEIFWAHIVNALQKVQPDIGADSLDLLDHLDTDVTDRELEGPVISLLNDLDELCVNNNSNNPITLVLDDFHRVEDSDILNLMTMFCDHLPPSIRVVLTCRNNPSLGLARRRANRQLLEIGEQDLAFNFDEGCVFFNETMNLALNDLELKLLFSKSEGWVVGLQLAALSLQNNPGTCIENVSLNRHTSDYLFDEVFALQEDELKIFMVVIACVPRFCAGLCNALVLRKNTEGISSTELIRCLDQRNLFLVQLDNHRTWYRFHDLFREFLLQRFSELPDLTIKDCHKRAAKWFEEAGYLEEAAEQFSLAEGRPPVSRLLEQLPDTDDALATQKLFHSHSQSNPDLVEPLTRREAEVMALVSKGLPNKKIASELHISLNTLKVHIRNLYGKMGVENRSQALVKIKRSKQV